MPRTPTPPTTPTPTAQKKSPTPPPAAAPSKAPARVRRRARIDIPPTPTTPTTAAPTPSAATSAPATASASPAKADKKRKSNPAPTPTKALKAKTGKPKASRGLSALDAAAKVLEGLKGTEAREGIQANDLIDRMQRASLWTSPGGKTPAATLYSALIREITVKKGEARFVRVSPGHFAFKAARGRK